MTTIERYNRDRIDQKNEMKNRKNNFEKVISHQKNLMKKVYDLRK